MIKKIFLKRFGPCLQSVHFCRIEDWIFRAETGSTAYSQAMDCELFRPVLHSASGTRIVRATEGTNKEEVKGVVHVLPGGQLQTKRAISTTELGFNSPAWVCSFAPCDMFRRLKQRDLQALPDSHAAIAIFELALFQVRCQPLPTRAAWPMWSQAQNPSIRLDVHVSSSIARQVRTGFASSQGQLLQMIEFSQDKVSGDTREVRGV